MPDKADAMTQAALFEKPGITNTTGQKRSIASLTEKQIHRMGKGGNARALSVLAERIKEAACFQEESEHLTGVATSFGFTAGQRLGPRKHGSELSK